MAHVMVIGEENDSTTNEMVGRLNGIGISPLVYESTVDATWFNDLNFCGCGNPEGVQEWLCRVLTTLKGSPDPWVEWKDRQSILHSDPAALEFFVLYVLDAMDLTEHGSSVGGSWLTKKGRAFLAELVADKARRAEVRGGL